MKRDDAADDGVIDGFFQKFRLLHRDIESLTSEVTDADNFVPKWQSVRRFLNDAAGSTKVVLDRINEICDYLDNAEKMETLAKAFEARKDEGAQA